MAFHTSCKFDDPVVVATQLPPPEDKPHPHDRCTSTQLPSGRALIEHVWGHVAYETDNTPCVCGMFVVHVYRGFGGRISSIDVDPA